MKKLLFTGLFALLLLSGCYYVRFYHSVGYYQCAGNDSNLYIFIPIMKTKSLSYKVVDAPTTYPIFGEKMFIITIDSKYNHCINEYNNLDTEKYNIWGMNAGVPAFDNNKIYWMYYYRNGRRVEKVIPYEFKDSALVECDIPNKDILECAILDMSQRIHLEEYHKKHGFYLYSDATSDFTWNGHEFKIKSTKAPNNGISIYVYSRCLKEPISILYIDELDGIPEKRYPWED